MPSSRTQIMAFSCLAGALKVPRARNAEKTLIDLAINRKEPIFASKFNDRKIYGHKRTAAA